MRLNALGLVRYGHFTNARLDFPRPAPGTPDLHVIYGANEAGKSTLFSGWMDLLFGIPAQSRYNFLHDYRALRLEAEIAGPEGDLALARIKGNANTLLDLRTGAPVPASVLGSATNGMERSAYCNSFSLDDETLEKGGESILDSKGELGQLLFSASAGLADLSAALGALQAESDDWFKPTGRKSQLKAHKDALADLTAARKAADIAVSDWRRLAQAVTQAEDAYREACDRRAQTQTRLEALSRDLDALPMLARLRKVEARLADLPTPRDVPADWRRALPGWLHEAAELAVRTPAAHDQLAALEPRLAEVPLDERAAPHSGRLDEIEGRFGAIAKESADLPRRRDELAALERAQTGYLAQLGRPGLTLEEALLAPEVRARLAALIEAQSLLESRADAAAREVARARAALADAPDAPQVDEAALARLRPLVEELRRADLLRAMTDAQARQLRAQAAAAQALALLAPWQGDACALAALDLPGDESLAAMEQSLHEAVGAARDAATDCARLEASVARLRAEAEMSAPLIGAIEARTSRTARDAAWTRHRAELSDETAAAFETAMQADDAMGALRLEQARQAEKLTLLRQEEASLQQARAARKVAERAGDTHRADLARIWEGLGVAPAGRTVSDLRSFAAKRAAALAAQDEVAASDAELAAVAGRTCAAAHSLGEVLASLGSALDTDDYAVRLAEGEALMQAAESLRQRARLQRDLEARVREAQEIEDARAQWQAEWDALCAGSWIGMPAPDAGQMRAQLDGMAELAALAPRAEELRHRIYRMEADIGAFQAEMSGLADHLGERPDPDPLMLWPRLRERLRRAEARSMDMQRLSREIGEARMRLEALVQRSARLTEATAPMRAAFPGMTLAEIDQEIAAIAQARDMAEDLASLRADLADKLRGPALDTEMDRLEQLDPSPARVEVETLRATLAAQEDTMRAAYAVLAAAQQARDGAGSDSEAARLEAERQTLIEQIRDEAQRYIARQAGMIAVEQALRLYRDTHRSGMMARAGAAFALLTDGRYTGLSTQPDGRSETLIALAQGGASKRVDSLSKGTRFQLYLALRAAGYQELAQSRPSVPFIADDIMETFDDTRSEAAFRLLADMARQGQVIYLTHHAHLCDIARRACPDVTLHDLGAL